MTPNAMSTNTSRESGVGSRPFGVDFVVSVGDAATDLALSVDDGHLPKRRMQRLICPAGTRKSVDAARAPQHASIKLPIQGGKLSTIVRNIFLGNFAKSVTALAANICANLFFGNSAVQFVHRWPGRQSLGIIISIFQCTY